jgi:hypothetical protein
LTNCPICSEELAGLLQCRQLVSGLPEVEPPLGFTMRVMANVAVIVNETPLWKRLFTPLKIRIPLQATAVVLIGVLSFYVYQKADYNKTPESAAPQNLTPPVTDTAVSPDSATKPTHAGPVKTVRQPAGEAKVSTVENTAPRIRSTREPRVVTQEPRVVEKAPEEIAGARRGLPIQVQGVSTASGAAGPIRMPRQPAFRLMPAEQELVNLGEPTADYELLVRARGRRSQEQDPESSSERNARSESTPSGVQGGRLIDLQPSSVLNILWYTVPQDQYQQFKNELAAQARIESEIPVGIGDRAFSFRSDGPLFIKVVVLAPAE